MAESVEELFGIARERLPRHVAIIMDGNNRWAKQHNLPSIGGHKAGVDAVRRTIEACGEYGIEVLTLFAFSSENWRRPANEVGALMELFLLMLRRETKRLHKHQIRLKVLGDISAFSPAIQKHIKEAEALTSENARVTLQIAANYGGRWDITEAARSLAEDVAAGRMDPADIDEQALTDRMTTAGVIDPDLVIRTSGEQRISNFLLWQSAYSEFYFSDVLWPDFGRDHFHQAMQTYAGRQRRFGRTSKQLESGQC